MFQLKIKTKNVMKLYKEMIKDKLLIYYFKLLLPSSLNPEEFDHFNNKVVNFELKYKYDTMYTYLLNLNKMREIKFSINKILRYRLKLSFKYFN